MSESAQLPPDPDQWQVSLLRLTVFPTSPVLGNALEWWQSTTGSSPETSTERRSASEREDKGQVDGVELTLNVGPLRIDWTAKQADFPSAESGGLPSIGRFLDRREWFRERMKAWLGICATPIKRIAFGGVLILPAGNFQAAYEYLDRFLRSVNVDPTSSDFLYRVNRKRSCEALPGQPVNRVTTWSVLKLVKLQFQLDGGQGGVASTAPEAEQYCCRLEFDINSTGDRTEVIPLDRLSPLLDEFDAFALEIATHGDRKI